MALVLDVEASALRVGACVAVTMNDGGPWKGDYGLC